MKQIDIEEKHIKSLRLSMKDDDGKEIGHAHVVLMENDKRDAPLAYLEDVLVDDAYRGQGLGNQLVEACIEAAREAGCYKFTATTRNSKEKVQNWYVKLGLQEWGKEFRIDFFDAKSHY